MATPPMAAANAAPDPRAAIEEFRQLAAMVQTLAQKYPEFTEAATQIMPLVQKGMIAVAGNASRTPEPAAPPVGA